VSFIVRQDELGLRGPASGCVSQTVDAIDLEAPAPVPDPGGSRAHVRCDGSVRGAIGGHEDYRSAASERRSLVALDERRQTLPLGARDGEELGVGHVATL
jgi:hypothetical protein